MAGPVTDPDLLAQLNATPPAAAAVTDPNVLAQLNGTAPKPTLADSFERGMRLAARIPLNAIAALPLIPMNAGVAARNLLDPLTGETPYELPSAMWERALDQTLAKPSSKTEKATDILGPIVMGGMASGAGDTAALLMGGGGPEAATQAPANFAAPAATRARVIADVLKRGNDEGLVVAPYTTNQSLSNWIIETLGGKVATQQAATSRNAASVLAMAKKAVGINPDAPLTPGALQAIRAQAGKDYQAVRNIGDVATDGDYLQALTNVAQRAGGSAASFPGSKPSPLLAEIDTLLQPKFNTDAALTKIDELRQAKDVAYRAGENLTGRGYNQLANALEDQIERALTARAAEPGSNVSADLVSKFRNSRRLIAVTHTIDDAMVPGSNDISLPRLAAALGREEPLSGQLRTAAEFASAFPKSTQEAGKIGSSGINHTDTIGPLIGALGEGLPWYARVGAASYPAARYAARRYLFSPSGQEGAIPAAAQELGPTNAKAAMLAQALSRLQAGSQ